MLPGSNIYREIEASSSRKLSSVGTTPALTDSSAVHHRVQKSLVNAIASCVKGHPHIADSCYNVSFRLPRLGLCVFWQMLVTNILFNILSSFPIHRVSIAVLVLFKSRESMLRSARWPSLVEARVLMQRRRMKRILALCIAL
jgi:hypothetical protein